jgi:hypothetical protein
LDQARGVPAARDPNLRALLIEGRKFARKVILVTTDYREFGGIARTFKPKPWELSEVLQ